MKPTGDTRFVEMISPDKDGAGNPLVVKVAVSPRHGMGQNDVSRYIAKGFKTVEQHKAEVAAAERQAAKDAEFERMKAELAAAKAKR